MIDQSGFHPAGGQDVTSVWIDFGPALYFIGTIIKCEAGLPVAFALSIINSVLFEIFFQISKFLEINASYFHKNN